MFYYSTESLNLKYSIETRAIFRSVVCYSTFIMNPSFVVFLSLLLGTAAFRTTTPPSSSSHHVAARIGATSASAGAAPIPSLLLPPPCGLHRNDAVADGGVVAAAVATTNANRRSFVARSLSSSTAILLAAATATARPIVSRAAAESSSSLETPYDDADYAFRLRIPSSWDRTEQTLSGRRRAVFFTDPSSKDVESGIIETLGIVAYTPVRDDFVSLASFGSVDEVGQATILPKGELAGGDASSSAMISATSGGGAYFFDYVAEPSVPAEPGSGSGSLARTLKRQHFRTIFTLLPPAGKASAGMTLVTITLQTSEDRYGDVKGVFDRIIDSYEKIK